MCRTRKVGTKINANENARKKNGDEMDLMMKY